MREYDFLLFGLAIAALGALALGAVMAELGRKSGATRPLVALGLGLGVIAFGAKLVLIASFDAFGQAYLERMLPDKLKRPAPPVEPMVVRHDPRLRGYVWEALPRRAPAPADNPTTAAKVALGRRLFNERRLSADDRVACVSCHDLQGKGGADGRPVSVGIGGQEGGRNAPTVLNAAFQSRLFWDGRAASLEEQALGPLTNPLEMGMPDAAAAAAKLAAIPAYRDAFAAAFGDPAINGARIARAIAAYERTLITPDTPYDRFVRGDRSALTAQQQRGMALFARLGCVGCHTGANFSGASQLGGDAPFRAFPAVRGSDYEGRYRLTEDPNAGGVWRIPSLRNVSRTAPYFHNGAVQELREAIRVMARVQLDRPFDDRPEARWQVRWSAAERVIEARPDAVIGEAEVEAIAAFLKALEGNPLPRESTGS
ncbi:cytochrome-c peroxidase [Endothiovibrio diazotrophicus]